MNIGNDYKTSIITWLFFKKKKKRREELEIRADTQRCYLRLEARFYIIYFPNDHQNLDLKNELQNIDVNILF